MIVLIIIKIGFIVKVRLDKKVYLIGIKVLKEELVFLKIVKEKFYGEWNYMIKLNVKIWKIKLKKEKLFFDGF